MANSATDNLRCLRRDLRVLRKRCEELATERDKFKGSMEAVIEWAAKRARRIARYAVYAVPGAMRALPLSAARRLLRADALRV